MARNLALKPKRFTLDEVKLKKAQKLLGAKTETETIELALEEIISEHERQRRAWTATERFLKSGAVIKDVFGRLGEPEE
jgi:Bacterial antitoxin of type II TA system, VapB